jgi:hypothetical protein
MESSNATAVIGNRLAEKFSTFLSSTKDEFVAFSFIFRNVFLISKRIIAEIDESKNNDSEITYKGLILTDAASSISKNEIK